MAKPPKIKISVRVDARQYEFLESRSILWNCTVSKFTEEMIEQGIMAELKNERSEIWYNREAKRNEHRMREELDQSEEAIEEREEISKGHCASFTPKNIRRAINETERRRKEREAAIAKGIEPPKYEKSAWDEYLGGGKSAQEAPRKAAEEKDEVNPQ